jgi:hypothetical protein
MCLEVIEAGQELMPPKTLTSSRLLASFEKIALAKTVFPRLTSLG